tara:strand:+ start:691 stop:1542 length:852 start_codon:yes stop_codon:yes gene_type:complete
MSIIPNAVNFDAMLTSLPQHMNFYLRGILNSANLSLFPDAEASTMTEDHVSGEFLEALRIAVHLTHPDMEDGEIRPMTYQNIRDALGGENIFSKDEKFAIETVGEQIRTSLGNFGLSKQDGKVQVFDTYDFSSVGGFDQFLDDIGTGMYPAMRTLGGILMPENADGSSKEEAMRVRINIPEMPKVIDVDFDDEPDPDADEFVFRGAMTNKRKSLWMKFTDLLVSSAEAAELDRDFSYGNTTGQSMRDYYDQYSKILTMQGAVPANSSAQVPLSADTDDIFSDN